MGFNTSGASPDSLGQWMQAFKVVYALTEASVQELSEQGDGLLRKTSGDGLQIRKITRETLQNNRALAAEIYSLALIGCLGFAKEEGPIQFRQDIAEKLGSSRKFYVISHEKPDAAEEVEADIEGIDAEAYASLVASTSDQDLEKKTEEEKSSPSTVARRVAPLSNRGTIPTQQRSLAVQNLASGIISQLRANEESRRKSAEKKREFQDELDRTKLKDRILKEEIKKEEINATERAKSTLRMKRNFGKPTDNK